MTEQNGSTDNSSRPPFLWGRSSPIVLMLALLCAGTDQAVKLWFLYGFDLGAVGPVRVLPVLDFVLVWNPGISYGLFQQGSDLGRWLLAGLTIVATIALWVWSARAGSRLLVLALALIIGGAIGNGIDRVVHGAVVDFVHFHVGTFSWYVFNLADVWIVAGVAGLLYDSILDGRNSAVK